TDLELAEGFDRAAVLALVAAVESRSEHPIARAIVEAAVEEGLSLPELTDFESVTGMGVRARAQGRQVQVGADRYMRELGLDVAVFADPAGSLRGEGESSVYAAVDGHQAAILALADTLKSGTPEAIGALHGLGLRVTMLTGDNQTTARAIADRLGID